MLNIILEVGGEKKCPAGEGGILLEHSKSNLAGRILTVHWALCPVVYKTFKLNRPKLSTAFTVIRFFNPLIGNNHAQ